MAAIALLRKPPAAYQGDMEEDDISRTVHENVSDFSPYERDVLYNILEVEGMTKMEVHNIISDIIRETSEQKVYKLKSDGKWKDVKPVDIDNVDDWRDAWLGSDDKWRFKARKPPKVLSARTWNSKDKKDLADPGVSKEDKIAILQKAANKINDYTENQILVPDIQVIS